MTLMGKVITFLTRLGGMIDVWAEHKKEQEKVGFMLRVQVGGRSFRQFSSVSPC